MDRERIDWSKERDREDKEIKSERERKKEEREIENKELRLKEWKKRENFIVFLWNVLYDKQKIWMYFAANLWTRQLLAKMW